MSVTTTTKAGRLTARFIRSLAMAKGNVSAAAAYASGQRWIESKQIADVLEKTAVGAMNPTSDGSLVDPIGQDVAALVRPFSVVAQLRERFRLVPPRINVVSQTAGSVAGWGDPFQSGGRAIALSALSFSRTTLTEKRVAAFSVVTDELLLSAAPEVDALIAADFGRAIGSKVDWSFLNPYESGSPAEAPASVTASGRIFTASAGTIDGIDSDLEKLIAALSDGGSDLLNAVFIVNSITAARLARMRGSSGAPAFPRISQKGGELAGLPVLVTSNIPRSGSPFPGATTLSLVDPSRIWMTDRDRIEVSISKVATVEMDSAPSSDASSGTGASTVSMFQTDSAALKAVKYVGWEPVAGTSHAATLVGVEW